MDCRKQGLVAPSHGILSKPHAGDLEISSESTWPVTVKFFAAL